MEVSEQVGVNVVGVQFMQAGKIYDFNSHELHLKIGDNVVVDTERGPTLAQVVTIKIKDPNEYKEVALKKVLRLASDNDLSQNTELSSSKVDKITKEKISELKLDMRLLKSEVSLGGNKVVIYFTAPQRVDFREMVKDLAGKLRARVELKQVGARDEAKLLGGIGICGREYCCSTFLREFVPVSIKMAKNQNLALNPAKLSGGCGRLRCCLTYEDEVYTDLRRRVPPVGVQVIFDDDLKGRVIKSDLLNEIITIEDSDGQQHERKVSEVKPVGKQSEAVAEKDNSTEAEEWSEGLDLEELIDHQKK